MSEPTPPALSPAMTTAERRASFSLAGIFMLRMLGLFMIFPVFSLHAERYAGHTPMLIGIAIGVYGLTQAIFQIPFGMISDRIGRKRVITAGLVMFAVGSALAALADGIWGVIAGRALQGFGAIAAATLALTADLTREECRTKAMAIIGVSIGLAFALALILGPAITRVAGLPGLFWTTGALALGGIAVLRLYVPNPVSTRFHRDTEPVPAQFARILGDGQLVRLDLGILILHLIMTATFVVLPLTLRDDAGLAADAHWQLYLAVLGVAVVLMVPFVVYADRRNRIKQVYLSAVLLLALSLAGLYAFHGALWQVAILMVVYFTAFTVLEASLPSMVSRIAPADLKGTALGVYSTAQYIGAFLGGMIGGWIHGRYGPATVLAFCAALCLAWLAFAASMRNPPALATHMLNVGPLDARAREALLARLRGVRGVAEAVIVPEDGVAYLKVDRRLLDREALRAISAAGA